MNHKKTHQRGSFALTSLVAGILNGLLGTGGGVPLYFFLSKNGAQKKAAATASVGVLLLSLQTVLLYRGEGVSPQTISPFLPHLAVFGGALGAHLLKKIKGRALRITFGVLLILSGTYTLGKEIFLAFFQ